MLAMFAAAALAATPAPPVAIPAGEALKQAILSRDAEFFELYFTGCDPARLRTMLAPDMEFYHDKGGFAFRGAEAMVADYAKTCAAKAAPNAWRSRRSLVPATLRIDPIPGYGAIEDGEHYFYEGQGGGPQRRVGYGRFTIVWALSPDGWRLSRCLSFAHKPAPEEAAK
ncbi:MAG TPA: nuclear transport factor 2 family protein [Sphingomicrobium sp.]|nr:nuclear transport factor 2 family protein [Sphingomicrobium sp.]